MSIVFLIILGAAVGFVATRLLDVQLGLLPTVALGIIGALIGGLILRALISIAGWASGAVGAVLGALLVVWIFKRVSGSK